MDSEQTRHDVEIVLQDGGAHVLVESGKRVTAKPGEVLRIRMNRNATEVGHAWTEDNGLRARTAATALGTELMDRITPKLREFLATAIQKSPQFDDGQSSTFKLTLGGNGYDEDDRPYFVVQIEATHVEDV